MDLNSIIDAQFNRAVEIVQNLPKTGPIQTGYEDKLDMYRCVATVRVAIASSSCYALAYSSKVSSASLCAFACSVHSCGPRSDDGQRTRPTTEYVGGAAAGEVVRNVLINSAEITC